MRKVLEECTVALSEDVSRFPWEERDAYADWLAQTYYYVCHSTRLLASAASRFDFGMRGDALHYRFAAHIAEEKHHEALAVHDLKAIGRTLEQFPERASTRLFYEPQYFKIEHRAPLGLFGYILPLEALGPLHGKLVIERVLRAHGEKCAAFLKVHTEDDVEHLEKAWQVLQGITPELQQLIETNMRQTVFAYRGMLDEIQRGTARG
jgi:hypothetical protein